MLTNNKTTMGQSFPLIYKPQIARYLCSQLYYIAMMQ